MILNEKINERATHLARGDAMMQSTMQFTIVSAWIGGVEWLRLLGFRTGRGRCFGFLFGGGKCPAAGERQQSPQPVKVVVLTATNKRQHLSHHQKGTNGKERKRIDELSLKKYSRIRNINWSYHN